MSKIRERVAIAVVTVIALGGVGAAVAVAQQRAETREVVSSVPSDQDTERSGFAQKMQQLEDVAAQTAEAKAAADAQAVVDAVATQAAADAAAAQAAQAAADQAAADAQATADEPAAPDPAESSGPDMCPGGTQANSSDGVNDTSCFPVVCFGITLPDPAHPECDYAYPPEHYR